MSMLIRIIITIWLLTVVYDETGWATTLAFALISLWSEVIGWAVDDVVRKTP